MTEVTEAIVSAVPFWILYGILGWHAGKSMARDEWIQMIVTMLSGVMVILLQLEVI